MSRRAIVAMLAAVPVALAVANTQAADLKVLAAGSVQEAFKELVPAFTRESGHKVETSFGPVGALQTRLKNGETADVIVLSAAAMEEMKKAGSLAAGSSAELGRAAAGIGVRAGAPLPDISTADALKKTLLAAPSIAYPDPAGGGTAGVYVVNLAERLGIAEDLKRKALPQQRGFEIAAAVADGKAEIGIAFISELLPNKGVAVVGAIPREIGLTVSYVAGVASTSTQGEAARTFISFLIRPAARERFVAAGL
jgi:molybdate transport system substrate-binding protein